MSRAASPAGPHAGEASGVRAALHPRRDPCGGGDRVSRAASPAGPLRGRRPGCESRCIPGGTPRGGVRGSALHPRRDPRDPSGRLRARHEKGAGSCARSACASRRPPLAGSPDWPVSYGPRHIAAAILRGRRWPFPERPARVPPPWAWRRSVPGWPHAGLHEQCTGSGSPVSVRLTASSVGRRPALARYRAARAIRRRNSCGRHRPLPERPARVPPP